MNDSVKPVDSAGAYLATRKWQQSPLGRALLDQESRLVEEALQGLFGVECLQLGIWGEPRLLLKHARTQHTTCIASPLNAAAGEAPTVFGRIHRLPVATDSIDVVILPHTLDFSQRQPEILREVHRVLRSDGHLIVLGFMRGGLWGLRRLIPGAGMPPNTSDLVSEGQLADWLKLLGLSVQQRTRYFFKWPLPGRRATVSRVWEERGRSWWPELAACYMLTAQKRLYTMTPIRQPWRARPKVVGGLVESSTRVSRIRFDRND
jgi:SAM-dependent methyltransferase